MDALNVIRGDPELRALERRDPAAARAELLRLLAHPALNRYEVWAVFDGAPLGSEPPAPPRVRALHSNKASADALIASVCTARDVVVTDDRGLSRATLEAGPRVWGVGRLLRLVRPAARRRRPILREEPPPPEPVRLRSFDVCRRCMYYTRDDWVLLCEEDGLLGRPANYREGW